MTPSTRRVGYSKKNDCSIKKIVQQSWFKNMEELHKEWIQTGVSASRTTTCTRAHVCVRTLLNHQNWNKKAWNISWLALYVISFGNQGLRFWRKSGEVQNSSFFKSRVKFPQSAMIWGSMSSAGVGPLCFIKTRVNTAIYQNASVCIPVEDWPFQ